MMLIKYEIGDRQTFPHLPKALWPVVMAVNIVAILSHIYCGKSVVQVLSPRGEVCVWGMSLGLDMLSRILDGRALSNPIV